MYLIHRCCKHFVSTVLVIAVISIFALANTAWATDNGVINSSVVNVRSGPGTSYTITGTILENTQVQIIQTQGSWDQVQFGSLTGWVSSSLITTNQSTTTSTTVTSDPNTTAITTASPRVMLDGKELSFEVPPIIENSRTLVPLRAIFEAMGATVQWNQSTQTVTATKGSKIVVLPLNSTSPTINGVVYPLDTAAKIINNRTLAPLRFVGEAFGGTVSWDATARIIYIGSSQTDTTPTQPAEPDISIKLSSSRDDNSVKIMMQSEVALNPEINKSNGQVVYAFKGCQISGTSYILKAPGSDTTIVQAANDENGATITFNLPAKIKCSTLRQDNGKTLIFSIPNYIINLQTVNYGNTERIILSTLCPVTYTSQQTGDQVQVSIPNILQGQAKSEYDINDQNLESINVTSGDASQPGITLNIAAHNLDTVSFGISGNNNVMNIILTAQQGGATSGTTTTSGTSSAETFYAKYQIAQKYIVNNRPGTALNPSGQVVHATADPGATALDIRNYFSNHPEAESSAHAVIDWNSIIEMIPENEKAWHAGPTANRLYLSFEMCEPAASDPDRYNKFQQVWDRAVWYCAKTCIEFGWSTDDNIFSHNYISLTYHETDHSDPYGYFAAYGKTWDQFLAAVDAEIAVLGQ